MRECELRCSWDINKGEEGALSWGGVANTFWMIDREAGLVVTFGTQVIPPGDLQVKEVITVVEKEVYRLVAEA